jgi:hypothetical protein
MQTRLWGKDGYMALKPDMSKAYDRVEWAFREEVMQRMGFDLRWIRLVMNCVKTLNYAIIVNGTFVG